MSSETRALRLGRLEGLGSARGVTTTVVVLVVCALFAYGAASTDGFVTISNFKAILTATSFVGIIAIGMTAIMLSGNLFSLSLGTTAAVTAMSFLSALRFGLGPAIVLTLAFGVVIVALQGVVIGALGANPIIVTIGAGGLQEGGALWASGGHSLLPATDSLSYLHLARPILGVPFGIYVFFILAAITEVVLRKTRFGFKTLLMGENVRAARAAAFPITLITGGVFAIAGFCTATAGVLIGAVSANGSLLLSGTYTYDAIAAALVGGNAVTGGRGSVLRTVIGAIFIAAVSDILLLRGYGTGIQILVKGIIVVVAVSLMNFGRIWNR